MGNITPSIKCLPCKHGNLTSIPRTHIKYDNHVAIIYNPNPRKVEIGGFLVSASQLVLIVKHHERCYYQKVR